MTIEPLAVRRVANWTAQMKVVMESDFLFSFEELRSLNIVQMRLLEGKPLNTNQAALLAKLAKRGKK